MIRGHSTPEDVEKGLSAVFDRLFLYYQAKGWLRAKGWWPTK
jgi:hypothetical protein